MSLSSQGLVSGLLSNSGSPIVSSGLSAQGTATVSGLVSGLDTSSIIQQLTQLEQNQIKRYQSQQTTLQQKLSDYQDINSALASVQSAAKKLGASSFFDSRTASSSNSSALSATAELGATPGNYQITVSSVAQAEQDVSQSVGDLNATTLGTGTFSITSGGQMTAIQVDASNNTLSTLRDAINAANTNVSASIVQDGDSSYRLMVSAKNTGTANALTISNTLSGGTALSFTQLQPPADAVLQLGSGANALSVTRSSNSVQDLIPGVTLNVQAVPTAPININVGIDTTTIETGIQNFVTQYNNAVTLLNKQSSYDPSTGTGGDLLGDYTLQNIQNRLQSIFTGSVSGSNGANLQSVGISTGADGTLTFDTFSFEGQLAANPQSVTQVFALSAKSSNAAVQMLGAGNNTVVDGSSYGVNITQAARQASVTAGTAQTGNLGADETLTINGVDVGLTAGMSQAKVIAAINARSNDSGVVAAATGADGTGSGQFLTLRSTRYGSLASVTAASSVSSAGGLSAGVGKVAVTASNAGGESGIGVGTTGLDVAGTINGEAATGIGQLLTGNAGNAKTDGLRLQITSTTAGNLGTIQLLSGLAFSAQQAVNSMTDPATGAIALEENGINGSIQTIQNTINQQQKAADAQEKQLEQQFTTLETTLSQLKSQSQYLTSQISQLS